MSFGISWLKTFAVASLSISLAGCDIDSLLGDGQQNIDAPLPCKRVIGGQFASELIDYSSEYSAEGWSAKQVLGRCDTRTYGDQSTSWAPKSRNGDVPEHVTVGFFTPVYAIGAIVRTTFGNNFIRRIETIGIHGSMKVVWSGINLGLEGEVNDVYFKWRPTPYLVRGLRITIDPAASSSWEEIDSVQLVGVGSWQQQSN